MCALLTFSEYFDLPMRDVGNSTTLRNNCIFFLKKNQGLNFKNFILALQTWVYVTMTKSKMWAHSDDVFLSFNASPPNTISGWFGLCAETDRNGKKREKTKKKVTNYLENVKKVCWRDRGRSNKLVPNKFGKVKECYAVFRLRVNKRISKRTRKSFYRTFPNRPKKKARTPRAFSSARFYQKI